MWHDGGGKIRRLNRWLLAAWRDGEEKPRLLNRRWRREAKASLPAWRSGGGRPRLQGSQDV
ncbi:hypothetical protein SESBI_46748 [Sesbania bispinosa]|nr:hypothetical protein SESBI_46748 [Sesbania bispinosa]